MSKTILKFGLGLLAVAGMVWPAAAAVTGNKTLHGHVPSVVAHLTSTGHLPATNVLHLAVGLPLHNQDQLKTLLQQVSDPSSPGYRQYLSPDEFTAKFGPTEQDVQSVVDYLKSKGLQVKRVHANRMLVEVEGQASDVENAFNLTLKTYHHPTENRDFFAPDVEPSVPTAVPVQDIQGLNNYYRPHPRVHINATSGNNESKGGSGPGGTYTGYDFRKAYVPGTTLTGTNQKVALFQWDGYLASDITAYEQNAGLPAVSLTNILLSGFSGLPVDPNGQTEVTLDISMSLSMAPGLSQILVYEGDPSITSQNTILSQIADDNAAKQISCSWGWGGGPSATTDQIFQQMILQGQTFFDASGDVCAFLAPGASGTAPGSVDDPNEPNAPSDDPYITQVGATKLRTTGNGSYRSESVWNWGTEFPGTGYDGVGSSGGISGYYTIPSWQQGVNMTTNGGSTTMRNLPDVSLTGEDIFIIVNGMGQPGVAGTSCAAPLWAGFTALVNQQAASVGLGQVGFLNPAIYAIANTTNYSTCFLDVTNGNNTWSASPNSFYSVPGYDLCTGLGSPNGTNLIIALAGTAGVYTNGSPTTATISAPHSPWGTSLSVMNGGNPNGDWFLFVMDDTPINYGGISNGWSVALTSANPVGFASDNETYATPALTNLNVGANWTVTIAVTNYGPSYSTNVLVNDTLPLGTGLTLLSSNASIGSVAVVGTSLAWSLGNLVTNTGGAMTLVFHSSIVGTYTNSATVSSTTPDPNPDDDTAVAIASIGASTPPVLSASASSHGQFSFYVNDTNGATSVIVQGATNLAPPVTWLNLLTNTTPFSFTDLTSSNFPARFYRVVTGP